jgi:hypothetical protein
VWAEQPDSARSLLENLEPEVERVYLIGEYPGLETLRAFATGELPPGWEHDDAGHYLEGAGPTLRYRVGRRRVEVLRAAPWYGDGAYAPDDAAAAWELTTRAIHTAFPGEPPLLSTPATTGRELLARCLPRGHEWPTLPDEQQRLVRGDAGQGRIEVLPRAGDTIPGLYLYDGRLMYAALCWGLPAGEPWHDGAPDADYLGQTRARYRASFTVPADWRERCRCGAPGHPGIGLLPVKVDGGQGWRYPAEPRETGAGWWDGAELAVALAHGWPVSIHERLAWPDTTDALRGWADRLVRARDAVPREGADERRAVIDLARAAVRAIVLHGIGALHGTAHHVTRTAPADQLAAVPADARNLRFAGDSLLWAEPRPAAWPEMAHPEWTAAIWARARARLLSGPGHAGALNVPAGDVLAFRTDAVYLTAPADWPDDGKAGRLREVLRARGPHPTPRDPGALLRLRDQLAKGPTND